MAQAFQKVYTKISQITKATCSLKAKGVGYDELATINGRLAQVVKIKGDEVALADKQMNRYKSEGFPVNYGLVQTNVMIRRHNDQYSKDLMEKWWSELKDYSHRDQLSFNYALWKTGSKKFKYLIKTTCNSKTFNWIKSHRKK